MVQEGRQAGIAGTSIWRLVAAEYWGRLGAKPRVFSIPVKGARLHVRSNTVDSRIALEVFGGIYDIGVEQPPETILDIGANIGAAALFFHERYRQAQIACVEPSPGNLKLLKLNLEANRIPAKLFACAAGLTNGSTTFYDSADPSCCSILENGQAGAPAITVETVTIPELLERLGWERIGLLKIDIEGYERVLLRGGPEWLTRVDAMVGEIHEGYDLERLRADVEPRGVKVEARSAENEYGQRMFAGKRRSADGGVAEQQVGGERRAAAGAGDGAGDHFGR